MSGVQGDVEALGRLDLEGLRAVWRHRYGPPPALRSVGSLRLMLAWRIQAQAHGGLTSEYRRVLRNTGAIKAEGLDLGVGARITREWQGRTIEVLVEDQGFSWDGKRFRSLSAVATAIAGTRWNGPRFFGLRKAAE